MEVSTHDANRKSQCLESGAAIVFCSLGGFCHFGRKVTEGLVWFVIIILALLDLPSSVGHPKGIQPPYYRFHYIHLAPLVGLLFPTSYLD